MNEYVVLKNEYLTLKISHKGASVVEVSDNDGNILLSGGPTILFPVCGGVYGDAVTIGGNEYEINDDGFAKDSEFMLLECYEDYAEFILSSDDDTVEKYPFSFNIFVSYKLLGKAFEINCRAGNFSEYKMPYSLGINTYFPYESLNAQFCRDEIMEGYILKNGLFCGEVKRVMPQNGKSLDIPENSEFVIKNIISDSFKLTKDGRMLAKVQAENLSGFSVRSVQGGMCVGMWQGFAGTFGKKEDFITKEGARLVDENSSDEYSFLISFNI